MFEMRLLQVILILAIISAPLHASDPSERAATPVADALGWYSIWFATDRGALARQSCRGEFREALYSFRCDPMAVVVSAKIEDSGLCSFTNLRPSVEANDGLRVNTLPNLVPQRDTSALRPVDCGELPAKSGRFDMAIRPRLREVDGRLTDQARGAALAFIKLGGSSQCVLFFPKVRTGDPFAHVYSVCGGVLESVMEFMITNGRIADFPHWTYDQAHRNLPLGWEQRLEEPQIWSGISLPEQRVKHR